MNLPSPLGKRPLDPETLARLLEESGLRTNRAALALAEAAMRSRNPAWLQRLTQLIAQRSSIPPVHPLAPSPDREVSGGDIAIGRVVWADGSLHNLASLPSVELTGGCLLTGATGSGKTRAGVVLLKQTMKVCPFLVFDPHLEYHEFFADEIRAGTVIVLDYRQQMKRNILQPLDREDLAEAIGRIAAVWRRTTFIRDGGENIIRAALRQLYQDFGVFAGSRQYPSIYDLRQALVKMKYKVALREAEYHSAVMNRIDGLISQLGRTYDCSEGFPMSELLARSVILRVGGMDAMTYGFFVDDLLAAALAYRRLERVAKSDLR